MRGLGRKPTHVFLFHLENQRSGIDAEPQESIPAPDRGGGGGRDRPHSPPDAGPGGAVRRGGQPGPGRAAKDTGPYAPGD